MPRIPISSLDDDRILPYRRLRTSDEARQRGLFVAEGRWLVERLLASRYEVESILVERRHEAEFAQHASKRSLFVVDDGRVDQLVGFKFHRGILACGRRQVLPVLQIDKDAPSIVVCCVGVCDPENLGGILRNCAAFGVHGVLLADGCADPFSRRVMRVSMATNLALQIVQSDNLQDDLARLRQRHGLELIATVLGKDVRSLDKVEPVDRIALLLGSEGHGLADEVVQVCQQEVTIPIQDDTDSLNVAVASGIFLHYVTQVWPRL